MFGDILGMALDRDMYDHPGKETTMKYAVRKWKDRPALKVGQTVTIVRMTIEQGAYGSSARVLIRNSDGAERWVAGTDIEPITTEEMSPALARCTEIASERFAELTIDHVAEPHSRRPRECRICRLPITGTFTDGQPSTYAHKAS